MRPGNCISDLAVNYEAPVLFHHISVPVSLRGVARGRGMRDVGIHAHDPVGGADEEYTKTI